MKYKCCKCSNESDKLKHFKRINHKLYCPECYKKKREDRKEFIKRDVAGIRKREDIIKEASERRKNTKPPIVRDSWKEKSIFPRNSKKGSKNMSIYLTRNEKQFLFGKYIKAGYSPEGADKKVKNDVRYLNDFLTRLKETKKQKEEVNNRFKEEFAKLLEC